MSSSNRVLNRVLLALIGVVAVGAGAWILLRAYPDAVPAATLPDIPASDAITLWLTVAGAVIVIALAVAWTVTRGRGRTRRLLRDESDSGSIEFDVAVAADVLEAALVRQPDIRSLHVSAHRVRRTPTLRVAVDVRSGCDLPRLRDDVSAAVDQLDRALERRIPVLLHVTSGVRAQSARERRVA